MVVFICRNLWCLFYLLRSLSLGVFFRLAAGTSVQLTCFSIITGFIVKGDSPLTLSLECRRDLPFWWPFMPASGFSISDMAWTRWDFTLFFLLMRVSAKQHAGLWNFYVRITLFTKLKSHILLLFTEKLEMLFWFYDFLSLPMLEDSGRLASFGFGSFYILANNHIKQKGFSGPC